VESYYNRAAIHVELGNRALAIKDYHTALSIDPSHINAYNRLGNILMKQEKHHEALDNYTKYLYIIFLFLFYKILLYFFN